MWFSANFSQDWNSGISEGTERIERAADHQPVLDSPLDSDLSLALVVIHEGLRADLRRTFLLIDLGLDQLRQVLQ